MDTVAQGFFMLRRPMFPIETFYDFNAKVNDHPDQFEAELILFFSQPLVLQAIFTASPGLYQALLQIKENTITGSPNLFLTLYKYMIRMCSRATPYGLFAGVATGSLSDKTSIQFSEEGEHFETHSRLDMAVLDEIISDFSLRDHIRRQSLFYVNSSLYYFHGSYRYVESVTTQSGPGHLLSEVEASENLDRIIALARGGCTIAQMQKALSGNITSHQANQLIAAAIDAQLIISELQANVTGPLYEKIVIQKLDSMQAPLESGFLKKLNGLISNGSCPLRDMQAAKNLISDSYPQMINKTIIQTDVRFQTKDCTIGRSCVLTLEKEFENIRFLMVKDKISALESFKADFFERYENREMPLLEVLDNESGIGYGDILPGSGDDLPLLDQLSFQANSSAENLDTLHTFKQQLLERALANQTLSVCLSNQELLPLRNASKSRPGDFYMMGSLITESAKELDSGNFKFILKAAGGACGFELMGRFCHVDPDLETLVKTAANLRNAGNNTLFAEIAHLPQSRTANILQRPHLGKYEIVYLAQSAMPFENQIHASDLMVSVPNGKELILRSKRLNKRVIPRLRTAHNFTSGLPIYRFLCDVCQQDSTFIQGWTWGNLSDRVFLPRVEYKHWILSPAKWTLAKDNFPQLFAKGGDFKTEWERICAMLNIPRLFLICQGDNELLIDRSTSISELVLKDLFYKQEKVRIIEFLQPPTDGLLEHEGNHFTNEIIIPFRQQTQTKLPLLPSGPLADLKPDVKRHFPHGSEWIYMKIYCGTRTADGLLVHLIKPICDQLVQAGVIEKWFFIRYQDPAPHIRLRFYHSSQPAFWQHVTESMHTILKPFIESSVINRFQTDTYNREIERYTGLDPQQTESIFYADSKAVLILLETIQDQDQNARWLAGLNGVDLLLDDFGLVPAEKIKVTESVYLNLLKEFSSDNSLTVQLNNQYRQHKELVYTSMAHDNTAADDTIKAIFRHRSDEIRSILNSTNREKVVDYQLIVSFVHMFLNRLFMSRSREQELVAYHYLNKYYKSSVKMRKSDN